MIFDYVIVGAGSAGAVLASRLSEDPSVSVLLVEAGPDLRPNDEPPEMRSSNPFEVSDSPLFRWNELKARRTVVQDERLYLRGRVTGGSSAINGQIAIRGMPEDFDNWAKLGCSGWSAQEVLPSFIRLEDDLDCGDQPYHGHRGPIPVSRTPLEQWGSVDLAMREAALELGYGWSFDHNAPNSTGVSPYAHNSRNGRRVSTANAYLERARTRTNLKIIGEALVDRVQFEGRRAIAIRVRTSDGWTNIRGREIMLCAGAIHSPAILMRSGIGPSEELHRLGISTLVDAPGVGQNLSEHPAVGLRLLLQPKARVTSLQTRFTNCCVRYSSGLAGADMNDMIIISFNFIGADETARATGFLFVSAFQAFSRGLVRLTAADPGIDPLVDCRMLSDERDLVRMRDGVRRLFALASHPAVTTNTKEIFVGTTERGIDDFADVLQIDEWMHADCFESFHSVGTCRMGHPADRQSVVDSECRVIGLEGLRVVDASIMPENPRANTHLTTVMIAEHVATNI